MNDRVNSLKPLESSDWKKVRDITIPIVSAGNGKFTFKLGEAVCFTGSTQARRLVDTAEPDSVLRGKELQEQANRYLAENIRRFRVSSEGQHFRVQLGTNAEGSDLQLRVLPEKTPLLSELRLSTIWRSLMLDSDLLNGGLILIAAPNGQGKTTTASSIVATRLAQYGGMANTIEDPIELPLQGAWGEGGYCVQRPVLSPFGKEAPGDGYYRAMIDALRQFPAISGGGTMLFVGEIRDGVTAAETLKAATNGHLVIATIHAKSAEAAVRRMLTLSGEGMKQENAAEILSESLRAVFNQRLAWDISQEGWQAAEVTGDVLWSDDYKSTVAQAIRMNAIPNLVQITAAQTRYANSIKSVGDLDEYKAGLTRAAKVTSPGK